MNEQASELRLVTLTEPEFRRIIREAVAEGLGAQRENDVLTLAEASEFYRYKDNRAFMKYAKAEKIPFRQLTRGEIRFLRSDLLRHMGVENGSR